MEKGRMQSIIPKARACQWRMSTGSADAAHEIEAATSVAAGDKGQIAPYQSPT